MTRKMIIDELDALKSSLERIDEDEEMSKTLALAHCVKALRHAKDADGLTPTRRQEARSAYRMGLAALGMDEAAA